MVRVGEKRNSRSKEKASDDSDEDYMVEEDFFDDVDESDDFDDVDESDDYCSSFDGDKLEEDFDDFEEKRKVKNLGRSEAELGCSNKRKIGFPRKRKRVSYNEAIDDEGGAYALDGDKLEEDLDDFEKDQEVKKVDTSKVEVKNSKKRKFGCKIARRRKRVSYNEAMDDEEGDYDLNDDDFVADSEDDEEKDDEEEDFDDEDDQEFMPEEVDSLEEEEDMPLKMNKNKKVRRVLRKNNSVITRKVKRNSNVLKKPSNRKGRTKSSFRSIRKVKNCDEDGFFTKQKPVMRENIKKMPARRKKRLLVQSDSDFESSALSDNDFTISEEDREQVIEAGKLAVSLRSSSSSNKTEVGINLNQQIKPPLRKGKDKVEDVKQVCGICLSEKGKRTIRGTLNCCNHYFCFRCILEWSKRESRCPLCKQRFMTISKHGKDLVIKVAERDQIYQPSDEELRSYLDPYEHVICTECHEGWDDNLMLLCDICDSPAHTYCVGLGQQVPEGNWYCDGCKPAAIASLNSPPQVHIPDQTTTTTTNNMPHRSSPFENNGHGLNPNTIMPSPFLPFSQDIGATTLSGRRYIQSHIRSLLSSSRTRQVNGSSDEGLTANLGSNYPGFQVDQGLVTTYHLTDVYRERVQENSSVVQNGLILPSLSSNIRRNVVQEPISTTSDGYFHGESRNGINLMSGHDQFRQCSNRLSIDSAQNFSSFAFGEANQLSIEKDQVQYMVERYLKSISSSLALDLDTCGDITRRSTHTILAACGLDHRISEVYSLHQDPPPNCFHVEKMINRQTSLMIRYCSSCFESLLKHVVKTILNEKLPFFLRVKD